MNYDLLTDRQKQIVESLRVNFENQEQLESWLSIPNKSFRNKPPLDLLMTDNFDYFDRFFKVS